MPVPQGPCISIKKRKLLGMVVVLTKAKKKDNDGIKKFPNKNPK
jgi:hypothetical protein